MSRIDDVYFMLGQMFDLQKIYQCFIFDVVWPMSSSYQLETTISLFKLVQKLLATFQNANSLHLNMCLLDFLTKTSAEKWLWMITYAEVQFPMMRPQSLDVHAAFVSR